MAFTLTNTANVTDNAATAILGPFGATTATVGGNSYLFVTGQNDDGISVFSVTATGTLTNVYNITETTDPSLELDSPRGLATATIGGTTYLFDGERRQRGQRLFCGREWYAHQ